MSIVVAVKNHTGVAIAADTMSTKDPISIPGAYQEGATKIHHCDGAIIGCAGAGAIIDLFRQVTRRNPKKLRFENADAIFDSFNKLRPYLKTQAGMSTLEFEATIVHHNGIFQITLDGCVTEYSKFVASGCGSELALGAMHALYNRCQDIRTIATAAVEAACEFSGACGLPLTCHVVGNAQDRNSTYVSVGKKRR